MSKPSSKAPPTGYPEFAVRRDIISRYFSPLLPSSTFYDLVNKGIIVPLKELKGFYKLNDSLRRLGLREVPSLPECECQRSSEDIVRLALTMIDPELFPAPSWMLNVEALDMRDTDHARLLADQHADPINGLATVQEKLAYAGGMLDANFKLEADMKSGGGDSD